MIEFEITGFWVEEDVEILPVGDELAQQHVGVEAKRTSLSE